MTRATCNLCFRPLFHVGGYTLEHEVDCIKIRVNSTHGEYKFAGFSLQRQTVYSVCSFAVRKQTQKNYKARNSYRITRERELERDIERDRDRQTDRQKCIQQSTHTHTDKPYNVLFNVKVIKQRC